MEPTPRKPGLIRVVQVPEGKSPLEIRQAWVGVEIPCWFLREAGDFPGYIVADVDALNALHAKSPRAAQWFYDQGFPTKPFTLWAFRPEGVQVIKSVMSENEFLRKNN